MSEIIIRRTDLLKAQKTVALIVASPQGRIDYRDSAARILAGDKDYIVKGSMLVAAFMGLEDLGLNESDAVDLITIGLKSLGVKVLPEVEGR